MLIVIVLPWFSGGCMSANSNKSDFDVSSLAAPLIATAAGVTAWKIGDNEGWSDERKLWTTVGAAGIGYIVADAVRQKIQNDYNTEYLRGYDLGASDETKRTYWHLQDLQRGDPNQKNRPITRYYTFPGVTSREGVNYVPHEVKVRMEE
jgi:hypothetical protein